MAKTLIHGSAVDIETTMRLAQLTLDGYGFSVDDNDDVIAEYLTGFVMKNGDTGPTTLMIAAADGYIDQVASGNVTLRGFTSIRNNAEVHGDLASNILANGQELNWKTVTDLVIVSTTKQQTTSVQIPINAEVVAVSSHVSIQPPGTSYMDVGVAGSAISRKRYGANISTIVETTHPGMESPGISYFAMTSIILTFDTTPTDNSGRVRLTVHYRTIVPPSS
jgi:hypothetical protein